MDGTPFAVPSPSPLFASSYISLSWLPYWMARENFSNVLISATTSSLDSVSMSRGTSRIFSAVPRPSRDSLPCSLHFSHDTQSSTRDTFCEGTAAAT